MTRIELFAHPREDWRHGVWMELSGYDGVLVQMSATEARVLASKLREMAMASDDSEEAHALVEVDCG